MKKTLIFEIPTKKVLNSNKVITHHMQKAVMAAYLRKLASTVGILEHFDSDTAQLRFDALMVEQKVLTEKSRARKRMNIKKEDEEDIAKKLAKIEEDLKPNISSSDIKIPFLFDKFRIRVTVCPPTRRKIDPPNLYPTVKALIDGLTDASFWEDDNFTHLLDTSFRYGGLSGTSETFKIILDIEEVEDISDYVIETEVQK